VAEIFATLRLVAALVGPGNVRGLDRRLPGAPCRDRRHGGGLAAPAARLFRGMDEPIISAIRWVSSWSGAGGDDIFPEMALQSLGRDRIVADALSRRAGGRISSSVWCGKRFRLRRWRPAPAGRGAAVRDGPCTRSSPATSAARTAALTDGLAQLHRLWRRWVLAQ